MRTAKVPIEVVVDKVMESLRARMDPEAHRVRPTWLLMMREARVCRQRIVDAIRLLKELGKIKVVTIPKQVGGETKCDWFYEVLDARPHK